MAEGLPNKAIARELGISEHTVSRRFSAREARRRQPARGRDTRHSPRHPPGLVRLDGLCQAAHRFRDSLLRLRREVQSH